MNSRWKAAALAAVLATTAACGGSDDTTGLGTSGTSGSGGAPAGGEVVGGGHFNLLVFEDQQSLDPHLQLGAARIQMNRFLYDTLIVNSSTEAVPRPLLAESWEIDGNDVTLKIRDDVTCSDGSPLTATTVLKNLQYVLDPANGSTIAGLVIPLGMPVRADEAANTVTMSSPINTTFLIRQLDVFPIVCDAGLADRTLLQTGSVGSGPYVVDEVVQGSEYKLTRRDDYAWAPDPYNDVELMPETVTVTVVVNPTTAANLLNEGVLSAGTVRGTDGDRLIDAGMDYAIFEQPVGQITFNMNEGHVFRGEDAARKAIAQALDVEQIHAIATDGKGSKSRGAAIKPYICGGVDPAAVQPEFDPEAARETLEDGGWVNEGGTWTKDGKRLSNLSFHYPVEGGPAVAAAAELLAQMLADIDITIDLNAYTGPQFTEIRKQGAYEMVWRVFEADTPTHLMPTYISKFPAEGGVNYYGYVSPLYDELLQDPTVTDCDKWNAAELQTYEDVAVIHFGNVEVPVFQNGFTFELGGIRASIKAWSIRRVEG